MQAISTEGLKERCYTASVITIAVTITCKIMNTDMTVFITSFAILNVSGSLVYFLANKNKSTFWIVM